MGFITWIVVGLIAGWLAGQVMKGGGLTIYWHCKPSRRQPPAYNANAGRSDYDTLGTAGHRLRGLPAARTR
jgi:hypothetical protein